MLNVNKKFFFLLFTILFTVIYLIYANLIIDNQTIDIDYKNFSDLNSCKYSINQIHFYDFEETDKVYQVYKHHTNFLKDFESIKCINKIQMIEDGWPTVKVYIYGDSLLFQIIKNSGLVIIFILFLNFFPMKKRVFVFTSTLFTLITHYIFSVDFISREFRYLYSYEIIFVEVFILYLIFLKHSDSNYLESKLFSIQGALQNISNKSIVFVSILFALRSIYIFFSQTYLNNISDWLINYNYGYIRRGFTGTILLSISDDLEFLAYTLIPIIIFLLHFTVVYLSLKVYQENNKNFYSLFLLFSPLYLLFSVFNVSKGVGNKELLGLVCLLLILRSTYKKLSFSTFILISGLFLVSVLSHEVNLFVTAMVFILSITRTIKIDWKIIISLLIISLIFLIVYLFYPTTPEIVDSLCNEVYLKINELDCTKAYYLSQDGLSSLDSSINRIFEDSDYVLVYGVYLTLGLLPFSFRFWIKENYKLLVLILISMAPLFLIAIDWGRWLHILIFTLTSIYFLTDTKELIWNIDITKIILLTLYSTLWRVPQCCVQEINLVYLFRFNKFNFLIYIFLIYTLLTRKKNIIKKIDGYIRL